MKNQRIISRRRFAMTAGTVTFGACSAGTLYAAGRKKTMIRLGGPVFEKHTSPDEWAQNVRKLGYRAAYCPIGTEAPDDEVQAYANAAKENDIVIAEVGAWSNPISPDDETRRKAMKLCQDRLALADRIGARCCVNISGSQGEKWDGHDAKNLTAETFDLIVEATREIIDAVKPTRSYYTLETMPWMYPDSPDSYLQLMQAIDRKSCAAHLDPVNLVCSPQRYYSNGALIRECFEKLGPFIRSCHAKDILLDERLTVHLDEVRPGEGGLDYRTFLTELSRLPDEVPLMLEHLPNADEYKQAATHVRAVTGELNLSI